MNDVRGGDEIAIRWRRLDRRGWEEARLSRQRLNGRARFEHEGEECALDYDIELTPTWETVGAHVAGHVGGTRIDIAIAVTEGCWTMIRSDGLQPVGGRAEARPYVRCIDLDLNFSPSTNLLPIRRLALKIGESADVRAAWLRFPSFALEPLAQRYTRTGERTYRYESGGGAFVADLQVDANGFVTHYPGFAVAE